MILSLNRLTNTNFLGVIINYTLSWQDHLKIVCNKVSKILALSSELEKNIHKECLLTVYHKLTEPHFSYCNIVWADQPTTRLNDLFFKQKKAIRAISYAKWNAHTNAIFT